MSHSPRTPCWPPLSPGAHILFPTDFSACATHALPRALAVAEAVDGTLHLVHVLPSGHAGMDSFAAEHALARLEHLRALYHNALGHRAIARMRASVVEAPTMAEGVLRLCTPEVRLIAMGTHGATPRADRAAGSCALDVVREAPVPTLVVPSRRRSLGRIKRIVVPARTGEAAQHYGRSLAAALGADVDRYEREAGDVLLEPSAAAMQRLLREGGHSVLGWPRAAEPAAVGAA